MIWTLEEIKARHKATGGHWFDPGALRFFSSRLSSKVFPVDGGALFITSEQFQGMYLAGGAARHAAKRIQEQRNAIN